MRKFRVVSFILLALLISLLLFWLAANQVSFFSLAMHGWHGRPQDWIYVVLNVFFLSLFILLIKFRRRATRLPASIYMAFIVALFVEMYGFHLTMYIVMWLFGYINPPGGYWTGGNLWYLLAVATGSDFPFYSILLPVSNVIIVTGILLIVSGWRKIYRAKGQFVTTGIYAHVRHPQYLGFLLITLGMNVMWMTISTALMWPILVILYYRLAKEEDKEFEDRLGEEYRNYKRRVPMIIPRVRIKN